MMEVALYVRVSTNRQQQQETIAQQIACLRAHVTTQPDWHLAEEHVYRDDGYSGAKLNRPGLDRLRDRAAVGAFERVLITAPDRLARNYVHQMLLIEELTQHGCQIEFLERPMSNDPHDHLLLQIGCAGGAKPKSGAGSCYPGLSPPMAICSIPNVPGTPVVCDSIPSKRPWSRKSLPGTRSRRWRAPSMESPNG